MTDPLAQFKEMQRKSWAHFAPLEAWTTITAAQLANFAGVGQGDKVLDVGCGTGVVAVTCARRGARVTGLDLTPELLERARENSAIAGVSVEWHEGDAEALPFGDGAFDIVVSQFGHMFAPRPEVAVKEMLRVLKPGGTLAFSTWPPELYTGRMFALVGRNLPPPPPGVSPPPQWGDPNIIRERLGAAVTDLSFHRQRMHVPCLSPAHVRTMSERTAGPVIKLVETLSGSDPAKLEAFRKDFEALVAEYAADNILNQDYLLTRSRKK